MPDQGLAEGHHHENFPPCTEPRAAVPAPSCLPSQGPPMDAQAFGTNALARA